VTDRTIMLILLLQSQNNVSFWSQYVLILQILWKNTNDVITRFRLKLNSRWFPPYFFFLWRREHISCPFQLLYHGEWTSFSRFFQIFFNFFQNGTLFDPFFTHFRLSTSGTTRIARSTGPSRSPRTSTWACSSR